MNDFNYFERGVELMRSHVMQGVSKSLCDEIFLVFVDYNNFRVSVLSIVVKTSFVKKELPLFYVLSYNI